MAFYRQYGFWRGRVAPLMESGTYGVPVPGNHELQSKPKGKKSQLVPTILETDEKPNPGAVGLDNFTKERDAFWHVIERFGASYFCGHGHGFNMAQPRGAAWQVLVGSGGSPWDALPAEVTRNPDTDRMYAWATVSIHQSGKVHVEAYCFDEKYGPDQASASHRAGAMIAVSAARVYRNSFNFEKKCG